MTKTPTISYQPPCQSCPYRKLGAIPERELSRTALLIVSALSERQRQVLTGLASSKTPKEVALDLGISPKTVEFHRAQVYARISIHDIAGLTRFAMRAGLVSV